MVRPAYVEAEPSAGAGRFASATSRTTLTARISASVTIDAGSAISVVKTNVSSVINIPKEHWLRKRPYQLDSSLELGKPEKSASYPSGHSTRGMMQALILAEIFPDKRDAILQHGRDIGWDRVLIGKHFYTDVCAGRVLAQAIVQELHKSPAFERDLAEVKAEVAAAQKK